MYFPEESFFFEFEVMVTPRQFLAGGEKREKTDEDSDPAAPAAGLAPDPSTQHIKKGVVLSWRNTHNIAHKHIINLLVSLHSCIRLLNASLHHRGR